MIKKDQKTILIVEDEVVQRKSLVTKFELEGFKVFQASNGEEGLKVALKNHPDIILLDLLMPKMDGREMLIELYRDKWGMGVPVFILSNLSDSKTIIENIKNGVSDYLVKSEYKIQDVVDKVNARLAEKF